MEYWSGNIVLNLNLPDDILTRIHVYLRHPIAQLFIDDWRTKKHRLLMADIISYSNVLKKISKLDDEEHIILNDLWVWAGVFSCIIYPNKKADYYSIWKRMYRINSTYAAKRWIARSYSIKSKRFQIKSLLALFRPWERTRILEFLPINKYKTSFAHEYF